MCLFDAVVQSILFNGTYADKRGENSLRRYKKYEVDAGGKLEDEWKEKGESEK